MSDDLSSKSLLIKDYGLFVCLAEYLAEFFGEVKYYVPWKSAYPGSNLALIGHGCKNVIRVRDFYDHVERADLIYYPDLGDGDEQEYLRSKGKRVWGTGKAENFENFRWQAKKIIREHGLPAGESERIIGVDNLRKRLENETAVLWVKMSTFREDWETKKFKGDYRLFKSTIDDFEHRRGAASEFAEWVIEQDIPDAVEAGYDGWCVDGQFPPHAMLGFEIKGSGLIGKVMPYKEFPEVVVTINDKLAPYYKKMGCRGNISTEIRDGILIDPCMRSPSPPIEMYPDMYSKYALAVWHGAGGEIIDPEPIWEYGCEIVLESSWAEKNWTPIYYPPEIAPFVKLRNYAYFHDLPNVLPMQQGPRVGAVIGLGHTLTEAVEKALKHAGMVEGHQIEADTESVGKGLLAIEQAQKDLGVNFTDEPIPTPDDVAEMSEA
jgi:hypothetical protein